MVDGFHRSKEGIQIAVNENPWPERFGHVLFAYHVRPSVPAVFEVDVSLQLNTGVFAR